MHADEERSRLQTVAVEFEALANEWHAATDHFSVTWRIAIHPAYQKIIGMGESAVPHILGRLRDEGGSWLWALESIARRNVAEGARDWNETLASWERWAQEKDLFP